MKIAVIGERFIDRNYVGVANRLSPEFPGPVVTVKEVIDQAGGAANVAANLRSLGCDIVEIYQPGHNPIKNRLFAGTHQIARWDVDDWVKPITESYLDKFRGALNRADAVIISDYNKGAITTETIETLTHILKCPVFIDTKTDPIRYVCSSNAIIFESAIFFPNNKEYAQYLQSYLSLQQVLRKEGSEGIKYYDGGEFVFEIPALASSIVSVNGAGDSIIAGFAYATCRGDGLVAAADFASRCAAVAVQKPLTATATLEEVENFDTRVRSNYK